MKIVINSLLDDILKIICSSSKSSYIKANIKKILIQDETMFQIERFTNTKAYHENIKKNDLEDVLNKIIEEEFNQITIYTKDYIYSYRYTKKGNILTNKVKNQDNIKVDNANNKTKNYLIKEGFVVPPLVDLGVMNCDGKIVKAKYDKFKQINKFLELIDAEIKNEKALNIIDFGCGKSYLTFILYYYLVEIKKMNVSIKGFDLKSDVIKECNDIKDKYGYQNIEFLASDIKDYKPEESIDMVITLHACDTATDLAISHAIDLQAKYIFSVPCCQHEINKQIKKESFEVINKYGLLKERFSAILTDAIRANILEYYGYRVNVGEFIDMEHSPKNILIKAVKTNKGFDENIKKELDDLILKYQIEPTLYELKMK